MKTLTPAEEDIMQILWRLQEANVAAIIDKMPQPQPAYNTVSTITRILVSKGFVNHRKEGRGHVYFPIVSKESYTRATTGKLASNYFKGSYKSMVSFFMDQEKLSVADLEEILKEINKKDPS